MIRGARARDEGTSMLEMVIVLPLLLLLLFALVEFGILFGRWIMVNNAAREGARHAVLFRPECDPAQVEDEVAAVVQNYASALGVSLPASGVTVAGQCSGAGLTSTVNVTLPFTFRVVSALAGGLSPTIDLTGVSVMRNEGPA